MVTSRPFLEVLGPFRRCHSATRRSTTAIISATFSIRAQPPPIPTLARARRALGGQGRARNHPETGKKGRTATIRDRSSVRDAICGNGMDDRRLRAGIDDVAVSTPAGAGQLMISPR
jgi:hypothetical protein